MRILIVADSHHDLAGLVLALKNFSAKVDLVVHLGDGVVDLAEAARAARVSLPDVGLPEKTYKSISTKSL